MSCPNCGRQGFSLAEILIACAIFSVLAALVSQVIVASYHRYHSVQQADETTRRLSMAFGRLHRQVRNRDVLDSANKSDPFDQGTSQSYQPLVSRPIKISYFRETPTGTTTSLSLYYRDPDGRRIVNEDDGVTKVLVADVNDFQVDFDNSSEIATMSVNFGPNKQWWRYKISTHKELP